jgi:hypothetical protein
MPTPRQLSAAIDRRLLELVRARARQRSPILGLLPDRWLTPLLTPSTRRLRRRLMTGLLALSVLILGAGFWLALQ